MTKLLVTGASGQLGALTLGELLDVLGVAPGDIVAGSRNLSKLADWAARGVETRRIDFDDPDLATNLTGIDRILLISTDALDEPGKRLTQHSAAIKAATEAGVGHVMPDPENSLMPFAPDHAGTEAALAASGMGYTERCCMDRGLADTRAFVNQSGSP